MGGGKGGSSTTYTERQPTQTELDYLKTQDTALKQTMGIAQQQEARSAQSQKDWEDTYRQMETTDLKNAVNDANTNMGTADQNVFSAQKANAYSGLDSGYANSQNQLASTLAQRGLGNSGIATKSYTDLFGQKANAMATANNQAYNQAVQSGDAYRQQKVSNLTGYAQLGRGMQGTSQNYLGQAGASYSGVGSQAGQQASSFGQLDNSYNQAQWNANAQAQAGKGAMTGSLIGAGASLGGAAILASDITLKDNIEKIGEINGINIYVWDWNEKGKELANGMPQFGVIAQEVQELYPDCIIEGDDGYLRVNYTKLFNEVR